MCASSCCFSSGWSSPAPPAARLRMTSVMRSLYGRAAATRCCALTMRDAAMSSIALVIFFVDSTVLIRRRRMRSCPPAIIFLRCERSLRSLSPRSVAWRLAAPTATRAGVLRRAAVCPLRSERSLRSLSPRSVGSSLALPSPTRAGLPLRAAARSAGANHAGWRRDSPLYSSWSSVVVFSTISVGWNWSLNAFTALASSSPSGRPPVSRTVSRMSG